MRKICCDEEKLNNLSEHHFSAVKGYLMKQNDSYKESLFSALRSLTVFHPLEDEYDKDDISSLPELLRKLILADVNTLHKLTVEDADRLRFDYFLKVYNNQFSSSPKSYLIESYNAYTLLKELDVQVCPYCDEEYIEIIEANNGTQRRTAELDHFFSKSQYPGLAMCFYNLIPVGKNCNFLKKEKPISKNPYEADIEDCTTLYPNVPIGVNMDMLPVENCKIDFHATDEIQLNLDTFFLENRYEKHKGAAHKLLSNLQKYDAMKQAEIVKMMPEVFKSVEDLRRMLFEDTDDSSKKTLLGKLKHDIIGIYDC